MINPLKNDQKKRPEIVEGIAKMRFGSPERIKKVLGGFNIGPI